MLIELLKNRLEKVISPAPRAGEIHLFFNFSTILLNLKSFWNRISELGIVHLKWMSERLFIWNEWVNGSDCSSGWMSECDETVCLQWMSEYERLFVSNCLWFCGKMQVCDLKITVSNLLKAVTLLPSEGRYILKFWQ